MFGRSFVLDVTSFSKQTLSKFSPPTYIFLNKIPFVAHAEKVSSSNNQGYQDLQFEYAEKCMPALTSIKEYSGARLYGPRM